MNHTRSRISWMARLAAAAAIGAVAVSVMSGCLIEGSRHIRTEGRYIGDQTLSMIEPDKTDKRWILAVMGEPTRRNIFEEGSEIWVWDYKRVRHANTEVLLVFDGDKRTETSQSVYVEFDGEIVRRAWRDRAR